MCQDPVHPMYGRPVHAKMEDSFRSARRLHEKEVSSLRISILVPCKCCGVQRIVCGKLPNHCQRQQHRVLKLWNLWKIATQASELQWLVMCSLTDSTPACTMRTFLHNSLSLQAAGGTDIHLLLLLLALLRLRLLLLCCCPSSQHASLVSVCCSSGM